MISPLSPLLLRKIASFFTVIFIYEMIFFGISLQQPRLQNNEETMVAVAEVTSTPLILQPTLTPKPTLQPTPNPLITKNGVKTYVVKEHDTVSSIANFFGVTEATIIGGNIELLHDTTLKVGMVINILPISGVYYTWVEGDTPIGVAAFFEAKVIDLYNWNPNLDINNIKAGQKVIIPGGQIKFVGWETPKLSSLAMANLSEDGSPKTIWRFASNNYTGSYLGYPYKCLPTFDEFRGTGNFMWPVDHPYVAGNDFWPELGHPGVDLGTRIGDPVYAADNGYVVFAEWGGPYGNLVVLDHNNGWKTFYAHLNDIRVACGDFMMKGTVIGGGGTSGNSTGPHLHFELINQNEQRENPFFIIPR